MSVKKSKEKEALEKELKSLIPKLDEEGLSFLIKQAQIHLYNMQVDAQQAAVLNKTIVKDMERNDVQKIGKSAKAKEGSIFRDIKESASGSGYHLLVKNTWISCTAKEIKAMVKIIKGDGTNPEIRERLYNWLSRERSDLLIEASISGKFDDNLKAFVKFLLDNLL